MSIFRSILVTGAVLSSAFISEIRGGEAAPLTCDSSTACSAGVVYSGNDPFSGRDKGYINGSPSLAKFNWGTTYVGVDGVAATQTNSYIDDFTITNTTFKDNIEPIGGTWSYAADAGQLFPTIIAIKAGPEFFLIFVDAGTTSGTWSTALLGNKEISHISFYDGAGGGGGNDPGQVPIPGAFALFAGGLATLELLRRRRKSPSA